MVPGGKNVLTPGGIAGAVSAQQASAAAPAPACLRPGAAPAVPTAPAPARDAYLLIPVRRPFSLAGLSSPQVRQILASLESGKAPKWNPEAAEALLRRGLLLRMEREFREQARLKVGDLPRLYPELRRLTDRLRASEDAQQVSRAYRLEGSLSQRVFANLMDTMGRKIQKLLGSSGNGMPQRLDSLRGRIWISTLQGERAELAGQALRVEQEIGELEELMAQLRRFVLTDAGWFAAAPGWRKTLLDLERFERFS